MVFVCVLYLWMCIVGVCVYMIEYSLDCFIQVYILCISYELN